MTTNKEKENLKALDLAENKNHQLKDEEKQTAILFEYKMLQMYGPLLGIYAIPNLQNYMIWNCIIFVRKGFYKDGKFKFDITFPADFPQTPPKVIFKSRIFHSLVCQDSGVVDLNNLLQSQWNYMQENMLYNVFSGLEKMFTEKHFMEINHSLNPAAGNLLSSKPHKFIEKALICVDESIDYLYINEPGTSLIINKYENGELDRYKNKLEELCEKNRAPEEKRKEFLKEVLKE